MLHIDYVYYNIYIPYHKIHNKLLLLLHKITCATVKQYYLLCVSIMNHYKRVNNSQILQKEPTVQFKMYRL